MDQGSNEPEIDVVTTPHRAEQALAIGYAPVSRRAGLAALFALDARLGEIVRRTRQPLVGQMRLVWWRDALTALDDDDAPAEPVLRALAREAMPWGVRGADLAAIAEGWEHLLGEPLDTGAMTAFAAARGGTLFDQAALLLTGKRHDVTGCGEGWALADLARRSSDSALAGQARTLARDRLARVTPRSWPRPLRPLGALVLLARSDLEGGEPGSARRVARLIYLRLTGR